jgi:MbtH protein
MTERPTNPFEDPDARYLVLVNGENQHSLWPASLTVPDGWRSAFGAADRAQCMEYVETHWLDIRPASLADAS